MVSAQLRFSRWRRSASALAVLSGLGLGAFGCGGGDSGPRDGGTRDSGGPPDLGDGLDAAFGFPDAEVIAPVACAPAPEVQYAASGLPLIETHPGAPVVLYIAYGGGLYEGSSSDTQYGGYNRSGSIDTYDAAEQQDIELSMMHLGHYFAMFDVNVTSDAAVRDAAEAWGWILITEDGSGGSGVQSAAAIGTPANARSWSSGSTVRSENGDRSRRIAHELGHNFRLEHSGVWDSGMFYKWEDWPEWDRVYGPIMGGGGDAMRTHRQITFQAQGLGQRPSRGRSGHAAGRALADRRAHRGHQQLGRRLPPRRRARRQRGGAVRAQRRGAHGAGDPRAPGR